MELACPDVHRGSSVFVFLTNMLVSYLIFFKKKGSVFRNPINCIFDFNNTHLYDSVSETEVIKVKIGVVKKFHLVFDFQGQI